MQTTKKILSLILAMVMVLGLLPAAAFATEAEQVYISVSYDGKYHRLLWWGIACRA